MLLEYNHDDCRQINAQIEEVFRAVTKDNILQPNISDDDF